MQELARSMDREVPEIIAGREEDDDDPLRTPYDHYLTELIGLLHHDGGDGSVVHDGEINMSPPAEPPPPPQGQSTRMTAETSNTTITSSGGQLTELPGRAVVVGAGEAEMASWLRQILEDPDRPAGGIRGSSYSGLNDDRGAAFGTSTDGTAVAAAAGKRPVKEQYYCPGCCRPPRSGGAGKRSSAGRAAEQRRRDKINEKLRTLQRLVPRSNKSDKASTLDGVIQHIKYLQHQLQMMSNYGYSMAVQPYLQRAGGGVVFGCRPLPPPSTTTTTLFHPHHQLVQAPPMLACPHHHGNAAGVWPPPRFPAPAGDPSPK